MVNLSQTPLSHDEHLALQKGLSFIPSPRPPADIELRKEFSFFDRRLRIHHLFSDKDRPESKHFRAPSAFCPRTGLSSSLEGFLAAVNQELINQNQLHRTLKNDNLPPTQRQALKDLALRQDIVIKPADKGGAIVVWPREQYTTEALRQLEDPQHYIRVDTDQNPGFRTRIKKYLDSCGKRGWIPKKVVRYLSPTHFRTPIFYLLPKIHKNKQPTPGRPICSANDSPTERISKFVDHYIGPLARTVRSYVRDTQHFLQILADLPTLPGDALLATVDVSSLYTNIPHKDGLKALVHYLNQRQDKTPHTFVLVTLARFVLTMNCFRFDEDFYQQTSGTAMGTKMAPNYAILFMARLEEAFLSEVEPSPLVWLRYIDDIFLVWTHGQQALDDFLHKLNSHHDTIKFTSECGLSIPFLDVKVDLLPDGHLKTSLYTKPTDAHLYLHYESAHPRSQVDAIPIGQFLRIRRICSHEDDFDLAAKQMMEHFLGRGYPEEVVAKARARAKRTPREELLQPREKTTSTQTIYVHQYNERAPNVRGIISHFENILDSHPQTMSIAQAGFRVAHSRGSNLRDILVKTDLRPRPLTRGSNPCESPCSTCQYMTPTTSFTSKATGRKYPVQKAANCSSSNVIYLITCARCGQQYVGQTSNTIHVRVLQHLGTIRNEYDTPVARHFNKDDHTSMDVKVIVIDAPIQREHNTRLRYEAAWISELRTLTPMGINVQE